jgi:DNA-binding LacI/PurR family transcriptional regulator
LQDKTGDGSGPNTGAPSTNSFMSTVVTATAEVMYGRSLDAVFCGSDEIARGGAEGRRHLGLRVPDDVALIGFDDWEIMSGHALVPREPTGLKAALRYFG